jgi:hypothetical protein
MLREASHPDSQSRPLKVYSQGPLITYCKPGNISGHFISRFGEITTLASI